MVILFLTLIGVFMLDFEIDVALSCGMCTTNLLHLTNFLVGRLNGLIG